jgi:polysaccharide export outer membrane protein
VKRIVPILAISVVLTSGVPIWAQTSTNDVEGLPPTEYVIGIEDVLRVFVWGEPDLTLTVRVRPDGKITVPLVNDVMVAGLTPTQVRDQVSERLSVYIRDPAVTVIVEEINSYRVYFLGEVQRQGALQFYRPTTLLQGVAAAGGLTEFAKKEITLIREESGTKKWFKIDYKRLVAGDPSQPDLNLEPGDTVILH